MATNGREIFSNTYREYLQGDYRKWQIQILRTIKHIFFKYCVPRLFLINTNFKSNIDLLSVDKIYKKNASMYTIEDENIHSYSISLSAFCCVFCECQQQQIPVWGFRDF